MRRRIAESALGNRDVQVARATPISAIRVRNPGQLERGQPTHQDVASKVKGAVLQTAVICILSCG
jgi:hypothetical protein